MIVECGRSAQNEDMVEILTKSLLLIIHKSGLSLSLIQTFRHTDSHRHRDTQKTNTDTHTHTITNTNPHIHTNTQRYTHTHTHTYTHTHIPFHIFQDANVPGP